MRLFYFGADRMAPRHRRQRGARKSNTPIRPEIRIQLHLEDLIAFSRRSQRPQQAHVVRPCGPVCIFITESRADSVRLDLFEMGPDSYSRIALARSSRSRSFRASQPSKTEFGFIVHVKISRKCCTLSGPWNEVLNDTRRTRAGIGAGRPGAHNAVLLLLHRSSRPLFAGRHQVPSLPHVPQFQVILGLLCEIVETRD
jgi:hypothetical protein